ncbi:RagB/SusD family nutrient uptake outer membrane protein [Flavitalea flava]
MLIKQKTILLSLICILCALLQPSCKKLVSIPGPKNTITTAQVFVTDLQAQGAMAGIYTRMINGKDQSTISTASQDVWSAGLVSLLGSLSSGELYNSDGPGTLEYYLFSTNKLNITYSTNTYKLWNTAYNTIYGANSVIEGIAASTSVLLGDDARKKLTGEAKFVRALAYFYLTNLFGDVPLALTVDFNKTATMPGTPQQQIYQQIIADLKEAQASLRSDYAVLNERGRPNKWAATALLARVYLYQGDYPNAAAAATDVINNNNLYALETDLNQVFLSTSKEAIWQLKQTDQNSTVQDATPQGYSMLPNPLHTGSTFIRLSDQLMNAFEPGDHRRIDWIDSTDNSNNPGLPYISFYPAKYKIGAANLSSGAAKEYFMVLRLSEMYFIRAEASALGAPGGPPAAITDLNSIRNRAGLPDLPISLNKDQVVTAIAHERQVELFTEWGHRWFDLKRTGRAQTVLTTIPLKLPWLGDYQLLYPIPQGEITTNHFLLQNPGYF